MGIIGGTLIYDKAGPVALWSREGAGRAKVAKVSVAPPGVQAMIKRLLVTMLLFGALAGAACADTWPSRPIRVVVGYPPGGAVDLIARLYAQALSVRLGQPVVVENRPGSGSNLAGDLAAHSPPDGYTLFHGPDNVFMSNPHIYSKMSFDPFKDLVPVSSISSNQLVLAVNPSVPAKDLREFVELARRTKPPLLYGSIGNGSQHHLAMELLKQHVDIDLLHVPYRGGAASAIGLVAGEVSAMFGGGSLVPTVHAGKVRGIASTGKVRNPATPELPTINELYPGYEALIWHGLFVPAGTPQPIIDRLRAEIAQLLVQPEFAKRLADSGSGEPYITTPEEFAARIKGDYEKYGKLIRSIGLKVE
jgi:tripartite-type tricarboxylate transporter receptor subunit TctC